jgi:hypothetical protein
MYPNARRVDEDDQHDFKNAEALKRPQKGKAKATLKANYYDWDNDEDKLPATTEIDTLPEHRPP